VIGSAHEADAVLHLTKSSWISRRGHACGALHSLIIDMSIAAEKKVKTRTRFFIKMADQ